jgi:hypothetical protein
MPTKPHNLDKAARDNRAKQLDPQNDAYWKSRGLTKPVPEVVSTPGETPGSQPQDGQGDPAKGPGSSNP